MNGAYENMMTMNSIFMHIQNFRLGYAFIYKYYVSQEL